MESEIIFEVQSIYGAETNEPYVNIKVLDVDIQVSPSKAREMALMLLESAEAAEQDAFLYQFASKNLGDKDAAAMLIVLYRKERQAKWEEEQNNVRE